ncbi:MAG: hypothetical protein ACYC35_06055 [Pirellulales bacterium]
MNAPAPQSTTGYARLSSLEASLVLVAAIVATAVCVAITLSPWASGFADKPSRGASDIELYRAEVDRIHAGQRYYDAAAAELRARGYDTWSVFNWRPPWLAWFLGHLPSPEWGRAVLALAALAVMLMAYAILTREGATAEAVACVILLIGAFLPCVLGTLFVMHELWSGAFIALSLCAYGIDRPRWGVAAGLAALVLRELALPYCLLMAGWAAWHRRRGEVAAWLVGLAGYTVLFGLHVAWVGDLLGPRDLARQQGWLQLGGAPFVISTSQMNAYLLLLPQWVTAVYFPLAMLGFAGWHTATGQRIGLTVCLYVTAFAAIGHPFNQYWGSMFAPLLCFGAVRAPASLWDLGRAAKKGKGVVASPDRGWPGHSPPNNSAI